LGSSIVSKGINNELYHEELSELTEKSCKFEYMKKKEKEK